LIRRQENQSTVFPLFLPLLSYLLISAASLFNAINPYEGSNFLFILISGVTLFWITTNHIGSEKIPTLFHWSVIAGAIVSLLGIAQVWQITIPTLIPTGGPGSTFGNKNMAAQYLLFVLPAAFYLLLSCSDRTYEWLYASLAGLIATYFIYTGTRAAWGGATVGFLTLWFCLRARGFTPEGLLTFSKRKWSFILGVLIFVVGMNTLPQYFISNFGAIPTLTRLQSMLELETDPSAQVRFAVWANSLAIFKDHPILGAGKGNFRFIYQLYARRVVKDPHFSPVSRLANTHNDYIQLMAETGILGTTAFILVLTLLARKLWLALKKNPDPRLITIAFALVAILAEAFWDFPFNLPVPTAFFWIYAGLLWRLAETDRGGKPEQSRIFSLVLVGLLTLLSTLFAILMMSSLRGEFYFSRGARAVYQDRLNDADRDLTRATWINPFNDRYHFLRGLLMVRKKDYPKAIDSIRRSLSLNPYNINALNNLGVAYGSAGNMSKAIQAFETSLRIWPYHIEAHNNLGTIYARQGETDKAVGHFQATLRVSPTDPQALEALKLLSTSSENPR
jgi:O-antigen ligase